MTDDMTPMERVVVAEYERRQAVQRAEQAEDRLRAVSGEYARLRERADDTEAARARWQKRGEQAEAERDEAVKRAEFAENLNRDISSQDQRAAEAELTAARFEIERRTRQRDQAREARSHHLNRALEAEAERDQARAEARRHLEHLRMAHPDHFEVNVIGERMCGCGGQWPCPAPDKRAEQAEDERGALKAATARVRAVCSEPTPHPSHDHLCPDEVLAALDHPTDTEETGPVEHTAGNAEDCPRCTGRRDLAYPFICPGTNPDTTGETETP